MLALGLGLGFGNGCSATGFGASPRSPEPPGVSAPVSGSLPLAAFPPIDIDGVEPIAEAGLGSLAIRKWSLRNGLRIITAPDPTARSVSYVTAYRVGSRDEDAAAGQTGLAHFCEHLMFAARGGTSGPGRFDRRLEELGGNGNATTGFDFTSYTDDLPPEALEAVIRLEAERMTRVDLTPEEIEREREIVIEERLQSSEDDIDGQLDELVYGQAYRSHPYRWPIVGRMADIRTATAASVTAFFARHYVPDHATVVIAGRFDEAAALSAMVASYGPLPAPPRTAEPVIAPERAPTGEVRAAIARAVPADRFMMGQPAPGLGDPDRAAYEILDDLLTGGPSARLYRALMVDRELASSLDAEIAPTRDPGLWTIVVQMRKSERAAAAEELIRREIARLIETPVPAAELSAARNRLETAFWLGLSSSKARAEQLGAFDTTTGDFRLLIARGAAYGRVTAADVSRVARGWLGTGAHSVVVAHPRTGPGA